ncbi:hypothetical protein BaRGS_00037235, partial [Batillaria attramentaria]
SAVVMKLLLVIALCLIPVAMSQYTDWFGDFHSGKLNNEFEKRDAAASPEKRACTPD